MEIESKTGFIFFSGGCGWIKDKALEVAKKTRKIGEDDPRRITHSLKVGLAITLVSLFYYFRPLYDGFGSSAMWAVLTVVVVFEFTVGATLSKSMNRGFATLLAGALGVGANYLASLLGGDKGEPIILGFLVFLLTAASTFTRFFPHIKARYDYGVLVFILTFSLVSVSGYRVKEILELAHQRLSTIMVGGAICIIISIFVCPVWAGEDLHNLVVANIEKLASFLQGFGAEYFNVSGDGDSGSGIFTKEEKPFLQGYKSILNTKTTEESLANFAWWESGHGSFGYRHPWKHYLTIGLLSRKCAHHFETLTASSAYINPHHIQAEAPSEFMRKIQESCIKMSLESGKALQELAVAIKTMTHPSSADVHIENSRKALKTALEAVAEVAAATSRSQKPSLLLEIVPAVTLASILTDVIKCIEKIAESIHELSHQAHFNRVVQATVLLPDKPPSLHQRGVQVVVRDDRNGEEADHAEHVIITLHARGSEPS